MTGLNLFTERENARKDYQNKISALDGDARILADLGSRKGGVRAITNPDSPDIQNGPFGVEVVIPAAGLAGGSLIDMAITDTAARTGPLTPNFYGGNDVPVAGTDRPQQVVFFTGCMAYFDSTGMTAAQFENLISGLSLRFGIKLGDQTATDTTDLAPALGTFSNFTALDGNAAPAVALTRIGRYIQLDKVVPVWLGSAANNTFAVQANAGGIAALPVGGVRVRFAFTGFCVAASKNPVELQRLYLGTGGSDDQRRRMNAAIDAARRLNAIEAMINGGRA